MVKITLIKIILQEVAQLSFSREMQKFINLKDYEINKIHFWPGFSSTSKDEKFAVRRSRGEN
jgi:hypothetical protein